MLAGAGFSAYLVIFFKDIFIVNIGFPKSFDYLMGGIAIMLVIEGARRTMGESLSIIGVLALLYAMFGYPNAGHDGASRLRHYPPG